MLTVFERGQLDKSGKECVLLLGGFDGIHVGHQTLFDAAKRYQKPIAITTILGGKEGGNVFTFSERRRIFSKCGASYVYEIVFSEQLKNTTPRAFADELFSFFDVKAIVCGSDFRFGKGAQGTPELLKEMASVPVDVLELKKIGGEKVSSTNVKKFLSEGNVQEANALLSHPYFMFGRVEHGRRVGHVLGFPTANISVPQEKFPLREGVYGGYATTAKGTFPTIINVGARPTFDVEERKIEAYLDGFDGDLYGEEICIYPTEFYRTVCKFPSIKALKEQLQADIRRLRND